MNTITDTTLSDFREALLSGNKAQCSSILQTLIQQSVSIEEIYEKLLKPSLYRVGELWEQRKISVATEHMASSIVENLLTELYLHLQPRLQNGKKAILASIPGEMHQIGVKMVNDVLETNGWETFFLGANVPTKDLINFAKGVKPDLFALSMSLYFNLPELVKLIDEVKQHFPDTKVIVGGQGFTRGGADLYRDNSKLTYCKDLYELNEYLK
jgi:methanogenic corrinoid protein MtbC1